MVEGSPVFAAVYRGLRFFTSLFALSVLAVPTAGGGEFGLPVDCRIGSECFVQQMPDMDPGPGVADPFCGSASYDGHKGLDIRVLSMADVWRGADVIAMADGKVLHGRDGMADRLIRDDEDRRAVAGRECGNGLVIDHGGNIEVQYCHLRQDSLTVKPGEAVSRGQPIGKVGASGMAQFPHIHVTVRSHGEIVDPMTGKVLGTGCLESGGNLKPLFHRHIAAKLGTGDTALLGMGLAGAPIEHEQLSVIGPPPTAMSSSGALVGWGWLINLRENDKIRLTLYGPAGGVIARQTSSAMERPKASYSIYAGLARPPSPGRYRLLIDLLRGGETVQSYERTVTIER